MNTDTAARASYWRGAALAGLTALISGVSVFVSKYGTQAVPDPFVYTTARNVYVGGLLLVALLALHTWRRARGEGVATRGMGWRDAPALAAIALVGGSVPFLLFFWGLTLTTAPIASFIQKTQFVWVAALAVPLLREAFGGWQAIALLALLGGTVLQGSAPLRGPGLGELLVFAATLLWSVEAVLARRTLQRVSPLVGAAARMAGGAVVMAGFLAASGRLDALLSLTLTQWLWVAGPGLFLLGYVVTWYAALRRAPALVVTSVLTLGAPVTSLLNAVFVTHSVPSTTLAGGAVLAIGAGLLTLAMWRGMDRWSSRLERRPVGVA
ncbi:MAG TPA: DMT family transporter [Chloroflexota bacterium]|nr:DMT family transporter [Chloroflexota bacterium]